MSPLLKQDVVIYHEIEYIMVLGNVFYQFHEIVTYTTSWTHEFVFDIVTLVWICHNYVVW